MLTTQDIEQILTDAFADWVRDLQMEVISVGPDHCEIKIPLTDRIARHGGIVSGQALATLADTCSVLAGMASKGEFTPFATTDLHMQFLRPGSGSAVTCRSEITRAGRALTFVRSTMTAVDSGKPVATATVTLMAP